MNASYWSGGRVEHTGLPSRCSDSSAVQEPSTSTASQLAILLWAASNRRRAGSPARPDRSVLHAGMIKEEGEEMVSIVFALMKGTARKFGSRALLLSAPPHAMQTCLCLSRAMAVHAHFVVADIQHLYEL